MGTYTKPSLARRPTLQRPGALGRQNGFHTTVRVLHCLGAVGVCDDLRTAARSSVRVVAARRGGAAGRSLGGSLPLRGASRDRDKVILLARAIPLGDPAGRQVGRFERGAFGARGGGACHGWRSRV